MSTPEQKTKVNRRFRQCEHWGKGGIYTADPATHQRMPVPNEAPDAAAAAPAPGAEQTAGDGQPDAGAAGKSGKSLSMTKEKANG